MFDYDLKKIVEIAAKYCKELNIKSTEGEIRDKSLSGEYHSLLVSSFVGFSSPMMHISELCISELYLIAVNCENPEDIIDSYVHCLFDYISISEYPGTFRENVDFALRATRLNEMLNTLIKVNMKISAEKACLCIKLINEKYIKYFG